MAQVRLFAVVLLAAVTAGCSMGKDTKQAEHVVDAFRAQMASGLLGDIYDASGDDWKKSISRVDSDAFLGAVNRKLGVVKSTSQTGWRDNLTTSGHVVVLSYHTVFEHGDGDESFTVRLDEGHARLSGYHINSMAMMIR